MDERDRSCRFTCSTGVGVSTLSTRGAQRRTLGECAIAHAALLQRHVARHKDLMCRLMIGGPFAGRSLQVLSVAKRSRTAGESKTMTRPKHYRLISTSSTNRI
jgi:hypothetical protein